MNSSNSTIPRHASPVPHRKEGDKDTYIKKRKRFVQNALGELYEAEEEVEVPRTTIFKPAPLAPLAPSAEEINASYQLQLQQSSFGGGNLNQADYRSYLHLRLRPGSPEFRAEQARYKAYAQLGERMAPGVETSPASGPGPDSAETLEGEISLGGDSLEGADS